MGRISRDRRDIYYRRAKEEGFRARSAYKLLQLDDELHFLSPPVPGDELSSGLAEDSAHEWDDLNSPSEQWPSCEISESLTETAEPTGPCSPDLNVFEYPHRAVDLCAAPGSWTQVLRRRLWQNYERKLEVYNRERLQEAAASIRSDDAEAAMQSASADVASDLSSHARLSTGPPDPPMIVAVDLQELAPIPGVFMLKGDITHASTCAAILSFFENKPADLVVCDGAPDVTGMRDIDEFIQMQLLLAALGTASRVLRPGGTFVCKVFRGEQAPLMTMKLMTLFADVRCCKPAASRSSSVEAFVVCRGFRPSIGPPPNQTLSRKVPKIEGEEEEAEAADLQSCAAAHAAAVWVDEVVGQLAPFLSCGDIRGMDSDRNYCLARSSHTPMPPTQPPTHPAYEEAVLRKKGLLPT